MAFTVDYAELGGWPQGGWDRGEFDCERRIVVDWADRVQFLVEMDTFPNNLYPYADGPAEAIVRRCKIHPVGKQVSPYGSLASYNKCIIQVWHSTRGPVWDKALGVFIDEKLFPAGMYNMVGRSGLYWDDGTPLKPNQEPRLDETLYEYQIRYERLLTVPSWVTARPGVCNSNFVLGKVLPIYFYPYTLKFTGCEIHARWALGLTLRYDVTATFLFKGSEWNKYWRQDAKSPTGTGGNWEEVYLSDGTQYIQHRPIPILF